MTKITLALVGVTAALAFATPSYAQNFQGFGAPNYLIEGNTWAAPAQQKPVMLKSHKVVKHKTTAR